MYIEAVSFLTYRVHTYMETLELGKTCPKGNIQDHVTAC